VGGARLAHGVAQAAPEAALTVIVNVGDDFEWQGLHVSPDLDTVLYTLAGREGEQGWGLAGDSTVTLEALRALGGEAWFGVGDRDLATHLRRSALLRAGRPLSAATAELASALGVRARLLPVTDDAHPTLIVTDDGELAFQEYFVHRGQRDEVRGVRFPGAEGARPAPGVIEAIAGAELLLIAPSNPFVSIAPMLAVPGVRAAIEDATARRLAVSPIVGGAAVKGPAAAMLRSLGHEVSALGVARLLVGLADVFVLDAVDAALAPAVRELGMEPLVTDTMMTDASRRAALARELLGRAPS
jgi:LPPG:FO 2-phospho-L-lactate transferase